MKEKRSINVLNALKAACEIMELYPDYWDEDLHFLNELREVLSNIPNKASSDFEIDKFLDKLSDLI